MLDKYDTFSRRFFAGLLDGLVMVPVGFIFTFAPTDNALVLIFEVIVTSAFAYTYSVLFHWKTGQTLGKKWMNIRVIDKEEGRLLTFEQALRRDSIYILTETVGLVFMSYQIAKLGHLPDESSVVSQIIDWLWIVWFLLEIISMMTNNKRRALHDMLAGSVVIKDEYWNRLEKAHLA